MWTEEHQRANSEIQLTHDAKKDVRSARPPLWRVGGKKKKRKKSQHLECNNL